MADRVTPASRLRALTEVGVVPEGAQVDSRRRTCSWHERGLRMTLLLEPFGPSYPTETGRWSLFVSPSGILGLPSDRGGADTVVAIRPRQDQISPRTSWVSGAAFGELVLGARQFVVDESDLCWLLTAQDDVARGSLTTWNYQKFAARVVKSLLLARQQGDRQAEQRALAILHSGAEVPVSPNTSENILVVARRRAEEISRDTGLDIRLDLVSD